MAEYIYGQSNDQHLGPYVILLASDVDRLVENVLKLREELERPTATTYGEFKAYWEGLFTVNEGFYAGYYETGRDPEERDAESIDWRGEGIEGLMAWSDSPSSVHSLDGLEGRYKTYNTYYCRTAVVADSDVKELVSPFLRDRWPRAAVTNVEAAAEALSRAGHVCSPAFETIDNAFGRLATLEYLAEGLNDTSIVDRETLLWLPDSITTL